MCGDLNIRILRCGHPFAMKRIHVFDNVENTDLTMQGYGRDKSAPTPGGVFVVHFVVECEYLTEYSPHYSNLLAALLADR